MADTSSASHHQSGRSSSSGRNQSERSSSRDGGQSRDRSRSANRNVSHENDSNASSYSDHSKDIRDYSQSQSSSPAVGRGNNPHQGPYQNKEQVKSTDPTWHRMPNHQNQQYGYDHSGQSIDPSGQHYQQYDHGGQNYQQQGNSSRGVQQGWPNRGGHRGSSYRGGQQGWSDRGGYQGNAHKGGQHEMSGRGGYPGNSDRGGQHERSGRGGYPGNADKGGQHERAGRGGYPGNSDRGGQQGNSHSGGQQDNSSSGGQPYRQNSSGGYWNDDPDVFLSKNLSSILRHNAEKFKLNLQKGGFIYVDEILQKVHKLRSYKQDDVIRIVESNDKKRFALQKDEHGKLLIRANQGHTMQVDDLDLRPLTSPDEVPCAIHGTYYDSWAAIKRTGLSRMQRNHIHMAMGEPGSNGVISGMRSSCEITIRINLKKAMEDGIKFFVSANNVILSPGNDDGLIPPEYFDLVMDRKKRARIVIDLPSEKKDDSQTDKKKRNKKNKDGKPDDEQTPENWEDEDKTEKPAGPPPETAETATNRKRAAPPDEPVTTPAPQKGHTESETKQTTSTSRETIPDVPPAAKQDESPSKAADEPWHDPIVISDADQSKGSMSYVISKSAEPDLHITVVCCGEKLGVEGSKLRLITVFSRPDIYVYHLNDENEDLVRDGDVLNLLRSKSVTKVLHNVRETSFGLLREYDVLLDGTPIWDIEMMVEKVTLPKMDLEALKEEFDFSAKVFKSWAVQNEQWGKDLSHPQLNEKTVEEIVQRGKLMDKLYSLSYSHIGMAAKEIKKDVYKAANPSTDDNKDLYEKFERLTDERHKLEKAEKAASKPEAPKPTQTNEGKKNQGGSGGGKNNEGKRNQGGKGGGKKNKKR